MKNNILNKLLAGAVIFAPIASYGVGNNLYSGADANGNGIPLQTQLRIDIDKDTDTVLIDRDDTTESLVTKAFVLKHADPYELRPYIRSMVKAAEVSGNEGSSHVECAKYDDGTGILIVTAEVKKFTEGINGGLSVEQLIKKLDKPSVTSATGQAKFIYFAKHEEATDLKDWLDKVFLQSKTKTGTDLDDAKEAELSVAKEDVAVDPELNALLIHCNPYNVEKAKAALAAIDYQGGNNQLKVSIYEVEKHNTSELGNDFQLWKNANPNMINIEGTQKILAGGISTEYIDFLMSKGKAKVFTESEMVISNAQEATLTITPTVREISATTTAAVTDGTDVNNTVADAPERVSEDTQDIGFVLKVKPVKSGKVTALDIDLTNTSIIGFKQDGSADTHTLTYNSDIVLNNRVGKYVIGGLEKKELTESVNKVPFLGSLPVLGWLFSSEETETKTSQLVVVIESTLAKNSWGLTAAASAAKMQIEEATATAGEDIKIGTDQYILDPDKDFAEDLKETKESLSDDLTQFLDSYNN